jgi:hypothetical protein
MRFQLTTTSHDVAIDYLRNRALQIAHTGAVLKKLERFEMGVWATFEYESNLYYALYLLEQFRGSGRFYKLCNQKCNEVGHQIKMITTSQCQLAQFFRHKGIPFILCNGLTNTEEYRLIESIYADKRAVRSGVRLINHIDEGLFILHQLDASCDAKLGYILHPLFQSDDELANNINNPSLKKLEPKALALAIEYRSVANEYLSQRKISTIDEIRLSPLEDVNVMLKADKIQNFKDFEKYHLGIHKRSDELQQYFHNWFMKLGLDPVFYSNCKEYLDSLNTISAV